MQYLFENFLNFEWKPAFPVKNGNYLPGNKKKLFSPKILKYRIWYKNSFKIEVVLAIVSSALITRIYTKKYKNWSFSFRTKAANNELNLKSTHSQGYKNCGMQLVGQSLDYSLTCVINKLTYTYIFSTWWCKPLIFQTWIFSSNRIHSLKYLRSTALGYKDIEIRTS